MPTAKRKAPVGPRGGWAASPCTTGSPAHDRTPMGESIPPTIAAERREPGGGNDALVPHARPPRKHVRPDADQEEPHEDAAAG